MPYMTTTPNAYEELTLKATLPPYSSARSYDLLQDPHQPRIPHKSILIPIPFILNPPIPLPR